MEMHSETAAAITDAAEKEIEDAAIGEITAILTEIVTETVTVTETATETATGRTIVTETAAVTEVRKQDRLPLLQIPADVKKSLFHNRLFLLFRIFSLIGFYFFP